MRLFIGFPVPKKVPLELQQRFASFDFRLSTAFHVTLKFLGDVAENKVSEILRRLPQITTPAFTLSFSHLGVFPSEQRPRVLWVALQPETFLHTLHFEIEDLLHGLFSRDLAYEPHLTLGRFRSAKGISSLSTLLQQEIPTAPFLVHELVLYHSILEGGRYIHKVLATFPLRRDVPEDV